MRKNKKVTDLTSFNGGVALGSNILCNFAPRKKIVQINHKQKNGNRKEFGS